MKTSLDLCCLQKGRGAHGIPCDFSLLRIELVIPAENILGCHLPVEVVRQCGACSPLRNIPGQGPDRNHHRARKETRDQMAYVLVILCSRHRQLERA